MSGRRNRLLYLIAVVGAAFAQDAATQDIPLEGEPSAGNAANFTAASDWTVQAKAQACSIEQVFEAGSETIRLRFEQQGPSEYARMTIAGFRFRHLPEYGRVALRFGADGQAVEKEYLLEIASGFSRQIVTWGVRPSAGSLASRNAASDGMLTHADFDGLDWVFVSGDNFDGFYLPLRNMAAATETLADCNTRFSERDADLQPGRRAQPAFSRQVAMAMLPIAARTVRRGQDPVVVSLTMPVSADGSVGECRHDGTGRAADAGDRICALFAGTKMLPALDFEGRPFDSTYETTLTLRDGNR
ncbi:hypothetical protein VCJ71_09325 [Alteriqipengyuania sp. WL0013]|uniref:hypothetical protein n=1 Tax=Alteriqipengyuania sp. WL0013 TaxID=3110773 RepID=UPI002C94455A|nr:hypothetical protein [Alteriqipengyuania sp. WL0013]MEB3416265.1 hypothetical protein [Alteriqipengyuania sp. WL0013]